MFSLVQTEQRLRAVGMGIIQRQRQHHARVVLNIIDYRRTGLVAQDI